MEDYNRLISSRVLDSYEDMIDTVPQPQMFGGKRMRKYVLPGSTEYDYPGTLSVGRMDGMKPATLAGDFWRDFGDGFPTGSLQPPIPQAPVGGKFSLSKSFKSANKALKSNPVSRTLVKTLAPELAGRAAEYGIGALTGEPSLGKVAATGAKSATQAGLKQQGYGRARGGKFRIGKAFKDVNKTLKSSPVSRAVVSSVAPELAGMAAQYGVTGMTDSPMLGKLASTGAKSATKSGLKQEGYGRRGGVMIRNDPSQFHSSVYPPALASYTAGKDAYGRGRKGGSMKLFRELGLLKGIEGAPKAPKTAPAPAQPHPITTSKLYRGIFGAGSGAEMKLPKSAHKRYTARGAIVAEVMKKHGMSLPEASRFVKEKGLY